MLGGGVRIKSLTERVLPPGESLMLASHSHWWVTHSGPGSTGGLPLIPLRATWCFDMTSLYTNSHRYLRVLVCRGGGVSADISSWQPSRGLWPLQVYMCYMCITPLQVKSNHVPHYKLEWGMNAALFTHLGCMNASWRQNGKLINVSLMLGIPPCMMTTKGTAF